jgi:hypothetical protein
VEDPQATNTYWFYGYPGIVLVCGVMAFVWPQRSWRWVAIFWVAHFITGLLTTSGDHNLLSIGVVLWVIFAIPCLIVGVLAAFVRRKFSDATA